MQSLASLQQDKASDDSQSAISISGKPEPSKQRDDKAAHRSKDDISATEEGKEKDHGAAWRHAAMAGQYLYGPTMLRIVAHRQRPKVALLYFCML